eukprot:512672-Prorocentrum_minimum.AAC.1
MVNSSWTRAHIDALWGKRPTTVTVFPPCDVAALSAVKRPAAPSLMKAPLIASVAQFRPEKQHALQVHSGASRGEFGA